MTDQKNDGPKGGSNQNKGSGSDTASAAKISAGTSVGNVGEVPMPHSQTGMGQAGMGQAGMGQGGMGQGGAGQSSTGQSAQGGTTASHTSRPMGGNAGPTGAGRDQNRDQSSGGQGSHSQFGQGSQSGQGFQGGQGGQRSQGGQSGQGGIGDTARQAAGQAQQKAGEAIDQATDWAQDTYERASSWASDAFERGSDQLGNFRSRSGQRFGGGGVQRYVAENPMMVGLVGLAAGLLLGALLPRTRREDEAFGEWADEVREQGLRYAQEATQRGREFVEESFAGDDARFGRHESEFRPEGPSGANRH